MLLLPMFLIACKTTEAPVTINTVSAVYIPQEAFECKPKPTKPIKQANGLYRSSDTGKFMVQQNLVIEDCKATLKGVKDIYNLQVEAQKNPPMGVDSKKPSP